MPISLKELENMTEEECFKGRGSVVLTEVVRFLKENQSNAYTPREITEALNKRDIKASAASVGARLLQASKSNHPIIKKKGVYYHFIGKN